jgi:hypothetical protein
MHERELLLGASTLRPSIAARITQMYALTADFIIDQGKAELFGLALILFLLSICPAWLRPFSWLGGRIRRHFTAADFSGQKSLDWPLRSRSGISREPPQRPSRSNDHRRRRRMIAPIHTVWFRLACRKADPP